MPESGFEKEMQQRMEELRLTPSAEVWDEVERRIRKEKKKRRILFWLPLLCLLGGGLVTSGIWLAKRKTDHPRTSITGSNLPLPVPSKNETSIPPKINGTSVAPADGNADERVKQDNPSLVKHFANAHEISISIPKSAAKKEPVRIMIHQKQGVRDIAIEKAFVASDNNKKPLPFEHNVIAINNQNSNHKADTVVDNLTLNQAISSTNGDAQGKDPASQDTVQASVSEVHPPVALHLHHKNWNWGVVFAAGRSNTAKGLQSKTSSSLSSTPSAGGSQTYYPASIRPAGSFAIGIAVQRPLSKRLKINFDLHYSYLSTKISTGSRVDSLFSLNNVSAPLAFSNFYRPPSSADHSYTNRYHFAGFSAELSWMVIKGRKFPVWWNNGLSFDRLLSSNALHFSSGLPGYYKDFSLLNHNDLFVSSSLSFSLLKKFTLDPFAQYSVGRVSRDNSGKSHFNNYGLRLKWWLHTK
jgi:hypothetical protein